MPARVIALLSIVVAVALGGGCGGSDAGSGAPVTKSDSAAAAPAADFPKASAGDEGIEQTLRDATTGGPEFASSVSVLTPGDNRIGFGLFDENGEMAREDRVALYVADADGKNPRGPFTARRESLAVAPAFESQQTAFDATPYVYVTSIPFPRPGKVGVVAVVRRGGDLVASTPAPLTVGRRGSGPPGVGDAAPRITTLTPQDVGGDLGKLTTRKPALRSLVDTNAADVLGRKPVVLGFATPQLCQTRVCGPVVDVMAELQSRHGDRVSFIQQEVYRDNNPSKGLRPQLLEYRLQTEPWTYVIDTGGEITARFEGAFSAAELDAAVRGVAP
jgi:hypothetical protein